LKDNLAPGALGSGIEKSWWYGPVARRYKLILSDPTGLFWSSTMAMLMNLCLISNSVALNSNKWLISHCVIADLPWQSH
jgi:hypothetical protein